VEHLPVEVLLSLIDECMRVLRSGGLLIFETPNPVNVLVSSSSFHLDPTHVKPVPAQLLEFLVESRGFSGTQIKWLHPYPETMLLADGSEMARRFNDYFYGPQDYAVITKKL
jgi:hypothetical protein